eukprot:1160649-Pelagomonas_calceolata.AAC.13
MTGAPGLSCKGQKCLGRELSRKACSVILGRRKVQLLFLASAVTATELHVGVVGVKPGEKKHPRGNKCSLKCCTNLRMYRCRSLGACDPGAPKCSNGYITSCKQGGR